MIDSRKLLLAVLLMMQILHGCGTVKHSNDCGEIREEIRLFSPDSNKYVIPGYFKDRAMWYYDSTVIAENIAVDIVDSFNLHKWRAFTQNYTFIDLRARKFYIFSTLNDTSTIIHSYNQPDTGKAEGTWAFFEKHGLFQISEIRRIADTIMNGITYQRVRADSIMDYQGKLGLRIETAYLRPDKKRSYYFLDDPTSRRFGSPVTIFEINIVGTLKSRGETVYVSDKLSPNMIKIFKAWRKRIKE